MKRLSIFIVASLVTIACAANSAVSVENAWARATPPGSTVAVVYAEVTATHADEIVAITTPVAEHVEMHMTTQVDGVMRMRPVATVKLPANEAVEFKSGGLHLMLTRLRAPLVAGENIALTFKFRSASAVTASAKVIAPSDVPHGH